jgi:serine phosphatase RsbU (regulator of sigma subunit)
MRYANCGHLSGILLRRDGQVEQLDSTGTLLGLFQEWDCSMRECEMFSGDVLALYTDGVTETYSDAGEEFGECGLVEALRQHRELPCGALVNAIADRVRAFGSEEQHDDITLIVAKFKA